ncbi:MAG: SprB repeat-containing protein, partial [Saprospiraceae bacterium]
MKSLYVLLLAALFLGPSTGFSCGYGFVGDCSTNIGLRINGTADSFSVAPCPGLTAFNGLRLGNIQSLALIRAKSINWESCQNNVTAVSLYFRVYQTGTPGGAWQMISLQENYNTLAGPYTTRYRSTNANADLVNGLVIGKDYTLEAYFRAEVDTIGDDFIPETFLLQNNDGANYHLTFRYGGPAAPPFTVVETKKSEPVCFGENSGSVSVAVYGDQSGLFYTWSNENHNVYALYDLAAGTYVVTVSGSAGYQQADTIQLGQPSPISNLFTNLVPLGCNNGTGQVTLQTSGGSAPYAYHWDNGQTGSTLSVTTPGNYTVTVTDNHGCSQLFTQFIPGGSAPVNQNITAVICQGEVYSRNDHSFSQPGDYSYTLPGTTGCDTVVNLHVSVLDAGLLIAGLPAGIALTCGQPEQSLCATSSPNAFYCWKKDGLTIGSMPCMLAIGSGTYQVLSMLI